MRIDSHGLRELDARDIRVIRAHARARRGKPRPNGRKPEYRSLRQILVESLQVALGVDDLQ